MFYDINKNWEMSDSLPKGNYIEILDVKDALKNNYYIEIAQSFPRFLTDIHFSKVEIVSEKICGAIHIPSLLIHEKTCFSFIYNNGNLIFVDRNNFVKNIFSDLLKKHEQRMTDSGLALYYFLEFMISRDLEKISSIQHRLSTLENSIMNGDEDEPIKEIRNFRSNSMKLYHYYIQLCEMADNLNDETQDIFSKDLMDRFQIFEKRVSLLQGESLQLWEYTSQVRDIYQEQLDVKQNKIMALLTIVTTIFMPLTLITGWYGMNFKYMPELAMKYGYFFIIGLSAFIIIALCIFFKKKKWW